MDFKYLISTKQFSITLLVNGLDIKINFKNLENRVEHEYYILLIVLLLKHKIVVLENHCKTMAQYIVLTCRSTSNFTIEMAVCIVSKKIEPKYALDNNQMVEICCRLLGL